MRPIDADAAPIYLNNTGCEQIKWMPTIDAVLVVHGRWVHPEGAQSETRACTICDKQVTMDFDMTTRKPLFKGCPYCFARMDGEEHANVGQGG